MRKIDPYLKLMAERKGSDLFLTTGAAPSVKIDGKLRPLSSKPMEPGVVRVLAFEIMDEGQQAEFERNLEMNVAVSLSGVGRFRVNIYRQRGEISLVARYIKSKIPSMADLNLPDKLRELVMERMGLILVVGATGSGKSSTLASMIDYRSEQSAGHILTIEDPIEFTFQHRKSIVGQREVGLDTLSYASALKEAMREAPDVIMIGEIRDHTNMEHALAYADTGHLCLSTLHATNTNQAMDRIINFFPSHARPQILMDLSINLKAVVSQRLVARKDGGRIPAVEILINSPYISDLIRKGELKEIKEVMKRGSESTGMVTFDQALYDLYREGMIELETALANADSRSDLEWQINFGGSGADHSSSGPFG